MVALDFPRRTSRKGGAVRRDTPVPITQSRVRDIIRTDGSMPLGGGVFRIRLFSWPV
ncbi:hypothetical protein CBM2585_A130209 [Cupriavidus taiwanensis]|nr:hypothetical protein CBM2585_A130209 [Cupriavidus taiwanensis]